MSTSWKKLITFLLIAAVMSFSLSSQAANLSDVSDTVTNHKAGQTGVTHTIKFKPASAIAAPGDLKIIFASEYDLNSVAPAVDITVSGGGVTWAGIVSGDLNVSTRTITLGWTAGTLTAGNQVTVAVNFVKNPASSGNYNITIQTGPDGFSTPTDSRVIPMVITDAGVNVTANVPYPATNPTITNTPSGTTVISSGATQTLSFTLSDVNNNNISYTVTPSAGTISVSPSPISPVTNTSGGVTVTFTYFANGLTGAQTITLTANDGLDNTGAGQPAQPVTYDIQLFII